MASMTYFYNATLTGSPVGLRATCTISCRITYRCTSSMDMYGNITHSGSSSVSSIYFNYSNESNDSIKAKFSSNEWHLKLGGTWNISFSHSRKPLIFYGSSRVSEQFHVRGMPKLYKTVAIYPGLNVSHIITASISGARGSGWSGSTTGRGVSFDVYLNQWRPKAYALNIQHGMFKVQPQLENWPLVVADGNVNTSGHSALLKGYPKSIELKDVSSGVDIKFSDNGSTSKTVSIGDNYSLWSIYSGLDSSLRGREQNEFGHYIDTSPLSDSTTVNRTTTVSVYTQCQSYSIKSETKTFSITPVYTTVVGYG